MGRKHRGGRAATFGELGGKTGCGHILHRLRAQRDIGHLRMGGKVQPAFEHRHVMAGVFAGKGQIGAPRRLKSG